MSKLTIHLSLDKDGVNRVVFKAGEHCKIILRELIHDLHLKECQLDELRTFVKKESSLPRRLRVRIWAPMDLGIFRSRIKVDHQFFYRAKDIGSLGILHYIQNIQKVIDAFYFRTKL